jgi:hypothetical protein
MKKFVTMCLILILAIAALAVDRPQEIKQIGPREGGQIAFVQEAQSIVTESHGIITYQEAKDIVWHEWQSQHGDHYQSLIEWSWRWKSWYGYSTLFAGGCAVGYMFM